MPDNDVQSSCFLCVRRIPHARNATDCVDHKGTAGDARNDIVRCDLRDHDSSDDSIGCNENKREPDRTRVNCNDTTTILAIHMTTRLWEVDETEEAPRRSAVQIR